MSNTVTNVDPGDLTVVYTATVTVTGEVAAAGGDITQLLSVAAVQGILQHLVAIAPAGATVAIKSEADAGVSLTVAEAPE